MSLVKWVDGWYGTKADVPTPMISGGEVIPTPVITLADLTEVVDGLKDLYGQVHQAREGFGIYNNSPSMNAAMEKAQRLIAQLEVK